jgi:hypothetical protein
MIRAFRAELARLIRLRVLIGTVLASLVFAFGGAAVVLSAAKPASQVPAQGYAPSLQSLATHGGGTEIFRYAAAFAGTMVFVVFVGLFALEFSRGTYRTMLLRQPLRVRLITGRLVGLLTYAAVALAATEVVMWVPPRRRRLIGGRRWPAGVAGGAPSVRPRVRRGLRPAARRRFSGCGSVGVRPGGAAGAAGTTPDAGGLGLEGRRVGGVAFVEQAVGERVLAVEVRADAQVAGCRTGEHRVLVLAEHRLEPLQVPDRAARRLTDDGTRRLGGVAGALGRLPCLV